MGYQLKRLSPQPFAASAIVSSAEADALIAPKMKAPSVFVSDFSRR